VTGIEQEEIHNRAIAQIAEPPRECLRGSVPVNAAATEPSSNSYQVNDRIRYQGSRRTGIITEIIPQKGAEVEYTIHTSTGGEINSLRGLSITNRQLREMIELHYQGSSMKKRSIAIIIGYEMEHMRQLLKTWKMHEVVEYCQVRYGEAFRATKDNAKDKDPGVKGVEIRGIFSRAINVKDSSRWRLFRERQQQEKPLSAFKILPFAADTTRYLFAYVSRLQLGASACAAMAAVIVAEMPPITLQDGRPVPLRGVLPRTCYLLAGLSLAFALQIGGIKAKAQHRHQEWLSKGILCKEPLSHSALK
jgi:hypothetical protein